MTEPSISAVIVTWRTGPALMNAVHAALAAPGLSEVVLVNHGNPPEVTAQLRDLDVENPRLILMHTGANLGFSVGCNLGARRATGDILLFLNPDTLIDDKAILRMARTGTGLASPWIVGARLLNPDGSEQRGARRGDLTPRSAIVGFLGLARLERWFGAAVRDIHREHEPLPEAAIDTPIVSGAAMMMRRDDFLALGGFDERYFLHVEDIDLCRRVSEIGGRIVFEPRAEIVHFGATSRASLFFVEHCKACGFVRYFWKFNPGLLSRAVLIAATPPIFLAFYLRALKIRVAALLGRGAKDEAVSAPVREAESRRP